MRASKIVHPIEFTRQLAKALGLDIPVREITLHSPCNGPVTVEASFFLTVDQGRAVVELLHRYVLIELPETDPEGAGST